MTHQSIQEQAKALGDPTRHRIFRYLADADDLVGVEELTDHLGFNHNAIRQHLAKLVEAGLVVRSISPTQGRGRPRQLFEVHPSADERWGVGGPYRRLSLLLVEMLRTGDSAVEVGRRAGQAIDLGPRRGGRPSDGLGRAMASGGFDPMLVSDDETVEFVLRHCPFADTAAADPGTICALHLGLAQGLAEQFEGVMVDELAPRDPMRAGCRLRFLVEESETTRVLG